MCCGKEKATGPLEADFKVTIPKPSVRVSVDTYGEPSMDDKYLKEDLKRQQARVKTIESTLKTLDAKSVVKQAFASLKSDLAEAQLRVQSTRLRLKSRKA